MLVSLVDGGTGTLSEYCTRYLPHLVLCSYVLDCLNSDCKVPVLCYTFSPYHVRVADDDRDVLAVRLLHRSARPKLHRQRKLTTSRPCTTQQTNKHKPKVHDKRRKARVAWGGGEREQEQHKTKTRKKGLRVAGGDEREGMKGRKEKGREGGWDGRTQKKSTLALRTVGTVQHRQAFRLCQ